LTYNLSQAQTDMYEEEGNRCARGRHPILSELDHLGKVGL